MKTTAPASPVLPLAFDRRLPEPLHRQLYGQLRELILAGRLPAGARLPSSRMLAADFGVSRNTVVGAYDQLLAEGYVTGTVGSGTYVSTVLPDELLSARAALSADNSVAIGRTLGARQTLGGHVADPRPSPSGLSGRRT